jgi:hypothetical protein
LKLKKLLKNNKYENINQIQTGAKIIVLNLLVGWVG